MDISTRLTSRIKALPSELFDYSLDFVLETEERSPSDTIAATIQLSKLSNTPFDGERKSTSIGSLRPIQIAARWLKSLPAEYVHLIWRINLVDGFSLGHKRYEVERERIEEAVENLLDHYPDLIVAGVVVSRFALCTHLPADHDLKTTNKEWKNMAELEHMLACL
ncbi:hypothetical protein DOTSEDRAFT_27500 [Dothistroma septosporum NZE10]|uniref:Uncharacterized protein n=1 Tax=Dothistroma septosporum (strain NZE10 / CBS 128990) TaxID=675120 RepID=N1PH69_DOTSN|nr:hypothetical protein DOTSEDRAFT_27500 [Dothistroma septosporum NZE10]